MDSSISFSVDPDLLITVFWLTLLAVGIGQVIWGSYRHNQAFSRPSGKQRNDHLRLWQQLLKWQVVSPSYTAPAELEEFACARDFIQSAAIIGSGVAIVLASIGGGISLAATGSLLGLLAGTGYFFSATLLFASLIGYSLGYGYGVWQLRNLTARKVAYGDLQPRRLADYRSALFPWIAGMLIVYAILVPLLLAPYLGAQIPLSPFGIRSLDAPTWALEVIPAAMLLTLVTGEIVMARIARLPRLLLTPNPQTAQRADNLLRAMTIGMLQGFVFIVIGFLAFVYGNIVVEYFWQVGFWHIDSRPLSPFPDLESFFGGVIGLIGFLLPALTGRIGGKISGWPWRPVRNP